jgi:hypothetical protein
MRIRLAELLRQAEAGGTGAAEHAVNMNRRPIS